MRSGPRDPRPHLSPSSCSLLSRPDACFQFLTKLCCLPRGPGGLKLRMGMSPHCGALGPCGLSWAPGGTGPAQPWLWSRCHWRRSCSVCGLGGQLGVAAGALGLFLLSSALIVRPGPVLGSCSAPLRALHCSCWPDTCVLRQPPRALTLFIMFSVHYGPGCVQVPWWRAESELAGGWVPGECMEAGQPPAGADGASEEPAGLGGLDSLGTGELPAPRAAPSQAFTECPHAACR